MTVKPAQPPLHVEPGHPYSPLPDGADVARAIAAAARTTPPLPGIDLRVDEQWELVGHLLEDYPETAAWLAGGTARFTLSNTWFAGSDAVFLALMLRRLRPRRLVEVGSGYSSALALDIADSFLGEGVDFTFIDVDTERLLGLIAENGAAVMTRPVQDVPLTVFTALQAGDVLAIDSSHVVKAGSDVQFLFAEVVPRLAPGVVLHIHDVFFPFEYPEAWLTAGVAFNEAYVLRALLQSSDRLLVTLWNSYLEHVAPDWFATNMPLCASAPFVTGGIWLQIAGSGQESL